MKWFLKVGLILGIAVIFAGFVLSGLATIFVRFIGLMILFVLTGHWRW